MKEMLYYFFICVSIIEAQQIGGYYGMYNSNPYYYGPQVLIQPPPHPRLLPFAEEELVDSVVEESDFFKIKSKTTVKEWLQLESHHQYLLGVGDREVTLVSMYKIAGNNYQALEYPVVMPYEINCATMFKSLGDPHGKHAQHGFVLIGFNSPVPMITLYRIKNFKLVSVTSWKRENTVQSVGHFKWNQQDRIVIVENANNTSIINVYGLKFELHLPHFWHIETLMMETIEGRPTFKQFYDGTVYMAAIQKSDSLVRVYTYKSECFSETSGSKFDQIRLRSPVVAKKVVFFEAHGRKLLMTVSLHTSLYLITSNDFLMEDTKFTLSADMIPLPISGGGVILLGKSLDGVPHIYTMLNSGGQWMEADVPKCRRSGTWLEVDLKECIGGTRSWAGATYIETEGYPSLLFADGSSPNLLYHFLYSTRVPSASPVQATIDELESAWNSLRLDLASQLSRNSVKSSDPTPICSIEPKLTQMQRTLSDLKSIINPICPVEVAAQEEPAHNVIVDEGRPEEVISRHPDGGVETAATDEESKVNVDENRVLLVEPITQDSYYSKKPTFVSPELEDNSMKWDEGVLNDRMMDFQEMYGH